MVAVELHKLNGDTSWLVRLPRPSQDTTGSTLYNLVLDPWLHSAPQVDGLPIFSRQTRIETAAFSSLAQLDAWLRLQGKEERLDAVLLSHPFTDHLHPETLTDADSLAILQRCTVFTTRDALSALRSFKVDLDANKVVNLSSPAVRQDADQPGILPSGIQIEHLPARDWALSPAWSKLHGGIRVSCSNVSGKRVQILYSPHGITPKSLPHPLRLQESDTAEDEIRVLIHSFDRQTLPLIGTVACGFPNVLDLIPAFRPTTVLATHDEHKRGEGIVGRLLSRQSFPLQDAQQLLKQKHPQLSCTLQQLAPGKSISFP